MTDPVLSPAQIATVVAMARRYGEVGRAVGLLADSHESLRAAHAQAVGDLERTRVERGQDVAVLQARWGKMRDHRDRLQVERDVAQARAAALAAALDVLYALLDRIDGCCEGTPKQPYAAIHQWIGEGLAAARQALGCAEAAGDA